MTETVRRTVANIKAMCDVSDRIQPYTANCEDITDMISILGHNSKIENIIKWITNYDVSVPVAEAHIKEVPVTVTAPVVLTQEPTKNQNTYAETFTLDLNSLVEQLKTVTPVIQ